MLSLGTCSYFHSVGDVSIYEVLCVTDCSICVLSMIMSLCTNYCVVVILVLFAVLVVLIILCTQGYHISGNLGMSGNSAKVREKAQSQ